MALPWQLSAAAYLLLVIGLSLIIFEFFTAGVGVAGLVGAGCFVMSCYGLANLPVRPWALALIVLAMFGFAVDIQTGVPRLWSVIAVVCEGAMRARALEVGVMSAAWLSSIRARNCPERSPP